MSNGGRIDALVQRLQTSPRDVAVLDELTELLRQSGDWAMLLVILQERAKVATDPSVRGRVLVDAATVCEVELGDLRRAEELFADAAALNPPAPGAAEAVARIRVLQGDFS